MDKKKKYWSVRLPASFQPNKDVVDMRLEGVQAANQLEAVGVLCQQLGRLPWDSKSDGHVPVLNPKLLCSVNDSGRYTSPQLVVDMFDNKTFAYVTKVITIQELQELLPFTFEFNPNTSDKRAQSSQSSQTSQLSQSSQEQPSKDAADIIDNVGGNQEAFLNELQSRSS